MSLGEVVTTGSRNTISRELILDTTLEILDEKGVTGLRLKDLAERLHVTVPNLYRYFDNREDIIYSAFSASQIAQCESVIAICREALPTITDFESFRNALRRFREYSSVSEGRTRRMVRLQALATLDERRDAHETINAIHRAHEAVEGLFSHALSNGYLAPVASAQIMTLAFRSYLTGLVVADVDPFITASDGERWGVVETFLEAYRP